MELASTIAYTQNKVCLGEGGTSMVTPPPHIQLNRSPSLSGWTHSAFMHRSLTHSLTRSFSSASHLLFPLQRDVVVVVVTGVRGFDGAASLSFSLSASLMIPAFGAHFRDIKGSSSLSGGATAPRGRIEGCVWKLSSLSYSRLRL